MALHRGPYGGHLLGTSSGRPQNVILPSGLAIILAIFEIFWKFSNSVGSQVIRRLACREAIRINKFRFT